MSIKIDRFELRELEKTPSNVSLQNKTAILIKDHLEDHIIGFIQVMNNIDENKELGSRIISTIEEYILEKENGED